jgi:hypothetical protein
MRERRSRGTLYAGSAGVLLKLKARFKHVANYQPLSFRDGLAAGLNDSEKIK